MSYKIADFYFDITDHPYKTFRRISAPYADTEEKTDFLIDVTEADIDYELSISEEDHFRGYTHSISACRKVAEWLPLHNAFLLHSACFDVDGVGVAFAAHSGTGKTTHMMLWQQLLGDRMTIVNGDKPIVRFFDESDGLPVGDDESHAAAFGPSAVLPIPRIDIHSRVARPATHIVPQGRCQINGSMKASTPTDENKNINIPFAYGTPWNGKEHLGCNMRTPLRHLCFIERAEQNSCEPMTDTSEAIDRIFNQVYMPKDPAAAAKTVELINRLMGSVKLWKIKCNMDPSAAQVAYHTIFG